MIIQLSWSNHSTYAVCLKNIYIYIYTIYNCLCYIIQFRIFNVLCLQTILYRCNIALISIYSFTLNVYSFILSIGTCRMRRFLAVLRSFFHSSLLRTFSCHPSPPTILPSCLTSSCHLFLGLPLDLVVPKFIYKVVQIWPGLFVCKQAGYSPGHIWTTLYIIPFWEFYFLPFSVHAQTNIICLTLLSLL